ncbi:hypothetical protein ACNKHN_23460 [Shigella flexneri]
MYVLDEPSIGLHQRDNERRGTLIHLRDPGNTVIVVEHDEDGIRAADHVIHIVLVRVFTAVKWSQKVRWKRLWRCLNR